MFILIILLSFGSFVISSLTTSVYSINDVSDDVNSLKRGDVINYEINGHSNWLVLNVDKENGTVDVVSDTNVSDLTIEPYKSVEEYNAIFQTEAGKFYDGKYVINSRTINKADSLLLDNPDNSEYWLANVSENSLMTNLSGNDQSSIIRTKSSFSTNEIYVVPYIGIKNTNDTRPDVGSKIDFLCNGIEHWFYSGQTDYIDGVGDVLFYLPEAPVALHINSVDDIGPVSQAYFDSFDRTGIYVVENWLARFQNNFHQLILLYDSQNYFDNKDMVMYFVATIGKTITDNIGNKYSVERIH